MKPITVLAVLAMLAGTIVPPAAAQTTDQATAATSTTISLAGEVVMRIRTGAGGYTAQQRADTVRARLTPILSLTPSPTADDVTVQTVNPNQSNILVRGHLLLTVDWTLAQANGGQKPAQLAQAWAANLRRTIPQVTPITGPQTRQDGKL